MYGGGGKDGEWGKNTATLSMAGTVKTNRSLCGECARVRAERGLTDSADEQHDETHDTERLP